MNYVLMPASYTVFGMKYQILPQNLIFIFSISGLETQHS